MSRKIFYSILNAVVLILFTSFLVTISYLYTYFQNIQEKQLKDELKVIAVATENLGKEYLSKLYDNNYRLTWINYNGDVIFDNRVDISIMKNHLDREEVKQALNEGFGRSIRYSTTLTERILYQAIKLSDGSVLRISTNQNTVLSLFINMLTPFFLILILAIIFTAILAKNMARNIVRPINDLNLEKPLENNTYKELTPLLRKIHKLQHQVEKQLNTLRQKIDEFNQITKNMKECLVLLDKDGIVLSMNSAACELFNVNNNFVGENFLKIYHKKDLQSSISRTMTKGYDNIYIKINNREYLFNLSRIESGGIVLGSFILAFDVTEQVNAERNRQEFTANVSHELKTPLQSIIGSSELIENNMVKLEDIPRFVGHIHKEAARLLKLIEDIIQLTQLDYSEKMPKENIDICILTNEIISILDKALKNKNIKVSIKGNANFYGVYRFIYEIIYNLCDNAIKYNNIDGNIDIEIIESDIEVSICVKDTGIGIPLKEQNRIFERFYRVDKSHSKKSGGTGLGLSIVKRAVQYHNGKINIKSEVGRGTSIIVIFSKFDK